MFTNRKVMILALVAGTLLAASSTFADTPSVSPPANNRGSGPVMPNIKLPDSWANPTTGGNGGYVSPPVNTSSGTVVNTSSGTAKSR